MIQFLSHSMLVSLKSQFHYLRSHRVLNIFEARFHKVITREEGTVALNLSTGLAGYELHLWQKMTEVAVSYVVVICVL